MTTNGVEIAKRVLRQQFSRWELHIMGDGQPSSVCVDATEDLHALARYAQEAADENARLYGALHQIDVHASRGNMPGVRATVRSVLAERDRPSPEPSRSEPVAQPTERDET